MAKAPNIDADVRRFQKILARMGRVRPLRDPLAAVSRLELPGTHVHALMWLGYDGELPMTEIARRIGVEVSNATHIVDRLEHARLVRRRRDAEDRRLVVVRLAPKGVALYRKLDAEMVAGFRGFLSLLTKSERGALLRTLERIVESLDH